MRRYLLLGLLWTFFLQACQNNNLEEQLPILGNSHEVQSVVDGQMKINKVYQTIPAFNFINQNNRKITNHDFDNTIYVADFFFTSCATICPVMHQNMLLLYNEYKNNSKVKFLSHSIDPEHDTPDVLKKYADKLGVQGNQWQFVTGPRDLVYQIAKNYLVSAYDDASDSQGKVHQGWFVLVDPQKQIRGAYDGTDKNQVLKLKEDIQRLLKQYKHS